jgi:hypothetical protein
LLQALTASWHAGHTLAVTETMSLSGADAAATVRRNLTRLKQKGWVPVDESSEDLEGGRPVLTDAGFAAWLCSLAW